MGLYLLIYIDKDFQLSAYFPDKYWLWLTSGNMWELRWLELLSEGSAVRIRPQTGNEVLKALILQGVWHFFIFSEKISDWPISIHLKILKTSGTFKTGIERRTFFQSCLLID